MENLVVLPGWTRDSNSYKKLVETAPSNFHIFVPSYKYLAPYKSMDVFEDRLIAFLKSNNLNKIYLLGHSLGGALALYFASKNPGLIKHLFLVDVKGAEKHTWFSEIRGFLIEHTRRNLVSNILSFVGLLKDPILNLKMLFVAHNLNLGSALAIKIPTTIIWGEEDIMTPLSEGKKLNRLIKNSALRILRGAGHDWILYRGNEFWRLIL